MATMAMDREKSQDSSHKKEKTITTNAFANRGAARLGTISFILYFKNQRFIQKKTRIRLLR